MRNKVLLFIFLYSWLLSSQATQPVGTIDTMAQRFMERHNTPSLIIGVYSKGREQIYYYGEPDAFGGHAINESSLFEIGSITKVFTGILLGHATQTNHVRLDQPIKNALPHTLKTRNKTINSLTFRQLATHTSGLPKTPPGGYQKNMPQQQLRRFLYFWHPYWKPGTHYRYSNLGFGLIGMSLSNIYQQPFSQLLEQTILTPLDMQHTYITCPASEKAHIVQGYNKKGYPVSSFIGNTWRSPSGAIHSTGPDIMRFLKANILATQMKGLLPAAIHSSHQPQFFKKKGATGLGWDIQNNDDGTPLISKSGRTNGFSAYIVFSPARQDGVFVLSNNGAAKPGQLAHTIINKVNLCSLRQKTACA